MEDVGGRLELWMRGGGSKRRGWSENFGAAVDVLVIKNRKLNYLPVLVTSGAGHFVLVASLLSLLTPVVGVLLLLDFDGVCPVSSLHCLYSGGCGHGRRHRGVEGDDAVRFPWGW